MLPLITQHLMLRDFTPADFKAFYATTEDPEYRRYYPENEMSLSHLQDVFARILASTTAQPRKMFQLAIYLRNAEGIDEFPLIGTCGVRIKDEVKRQASFGCAIARPYWSAGYAYEASHKIIDFGFTYLLIDRIYAETLAENSRACLLAERLGMRLEGESGQARFFRGLWWDKVIYAITKDEWQGL
jgi:ribosomal-protein-alanine N-acetyltransferase